MEFIQITEMVNIIRDEKGEKKTKDPRIDVGVVKLKLNVVCQI